MPTKLYVVHGSHPCAVVERALELKGVDFRRVEYLPPFHAAIQRVRFGARTVPSIRFADGEKVSGSSAILRRLDERAPEPRMLPDDPRVVAAEAWASETLQPIARRVLWRAFVRDPRAMEGYQEGSGLPALPTPLLRVVAPVIARIELRMNAASEEAVRADLRALPGYLDRIDAWIAEGVLGGDPPNGADLQVASTLRLLLTLADLRPLIDGRPAGDLARRLYPHHQGDTPAGTLPAAWLPDAHLGPGNPAVGPI